jgi:hypothetical protein
MSTEFTPEEIQRRLVALDRLRSMSIEFPPDYKFDREEANSRDGLERWINSGETPIRQSESNLD